MNNFEKQYLALIKDILDNGFVKDDRTGTGTKAVFGRMITVDLNEGFPAVTTKKLAFKTMAGELACFLKGYTNIAEYHKRGVKIWDANLKKTFGENATDLGPIYGAQWRNFNGVDQLRDVLDRAKSNPNDRRLMVTAWNPPDLHKMALPPCHYNWQIFIADNKVSLSFNMRSVDVMLGMPFDIASYALLTHLIANELGYGVGTLTGFFGDTHIYLNHLEGAEISLSRQVYALPKLELNMDKGTPIELYEPEMSKLLDYQCGETIKMEMSA